MPIHKIDSVNFNYQLFGDKKNLSPIVFISGYLGGIDFWEPIAKKLSKDRQVLIFDNQGIGKTTDDQKPLTIEKMAFYVKKLMDDLGVSKPLLVGFAMGAGIAQRIAYEHPNAISHLILVGAVMTFSDWAKKICEQLCTFRETGKVIEYSDLLYNTGFSAAFRKALSRDAFREQFIPTIGSQQSLENQKRQLQALQSFDSREWAHKITVPTTVIAPAEDQFATPDESNALVKAISLSGVRVELMILPKAAHAVVIEQPERIQEIISKLSAGIPDDSHISSAEMTAYWRSECPELSGDRLSQRLASEEGIHKAIKFAESYDYPMIGRHISARAGHILQQAVHALSTNTYDICISLGSGFSLLSYYIALATQQFAPKLRVLDIDLPHMVSERKKRLKEIETLLDSQVYSRIFTQALDLEKSCREGKKFKDIFPGCQSPVFIIEGLIYFLSHPCVDWIFDQISSYDNAVVIFDYWPDNIVNVSKCFARVFDTLNQIIPEQVKSFWDQLSMDKLYSQFNDVDDQTIQKIEHELSILAGEQPKFIDINQFFPVHNITAKKKKYASHRRMVL